MDGVKDLEIAIHHLVANVVSYGWVAKYDKNMGT